MSSGRDNSLKQWVFDGVDGGARLLRFRSGHAAPPTVVRHYGSGRLLLSAGARLGLPAPACRAAPPACLPCPGASTRQPVTLRNRLAAQPARPATPAPRRAGQDRAFRAFSTWVDAQSRELSQHHTARRAKRLRIEERELKLAPVTALDACDVSPTDERRCSCCLLAELGSCGGEGLVGGGGGSQRRRCWCALHPKPPSRARPLPTRPPSPAFARAASPHPPRRCASATGPT